jgi:hypothetical protein
MEENIWSYSPEGFEGVWRETDGTAMGIIVKIRVITPGPGDLESPVDDQAEWHSINQREALQ